MTSNLVTASNRKRIIIIASVVLVGLIFITFRPREPSTWRPWAKPGPGSTTPVYQDHNVGSPAGPANSNPSAAVDSGSYHEGQKEQGAALSKEASKHTAAVVPAHAAATGAAAASTDDVCKTHVNIDDALIIMKTGATEAYDKLPIHFLTTLRCANDTIFFSDMEMNMGGYHIRDALKDIKPSVKDGNSDFELYDLLQEYHELYADPRSLKNGGNGWNLDKYKFNQIMLKTWQYRQDAPWYIFIEADTYVVWDNLRVLLDKYDPNKPYYFGSPTYLDIEFAHGGTGYIFSRAAMEKGVGKHPDIADKYDKEIKGYCCGDRFPAKVMLDENIKLTKVWPMFNGEKPMTLPYGKNHWCQPLMTMHHLTAQEISEVWAYEGERRRKGIKGPIMIKDMYEHFVQDNLNSVNPAVREDWDNLSNDMLYKPDLELKDRGGVNDGHDFQSLPDIKRQSVQSPKACAILCDSLDDCFGWVHKDDMCRTSKSIKIGGHSPPDQGKKFTSGWNMKKVNAFIGEMDDCPNGPDWTIRGI